MNNPKATDLDTILRNLIANPDRLDEVKTELQRGAKAQPKKSRWSSTAYDDLDDMFDNVPV